MARILIIDDERIVRLSIQALLHHRGHEVTLAGNGREGIELAGKARYDLVITDLVMPEMEGIETIRALRKLPSPPKVLAISGGGRSQVPEYLNAAIQLGADLGLKKPFSSADLIGAVDRLVGSDVDADSVDK